MFQEHGIITDQFGKVVAYAVIRTSPADQNDRGIITAGIDRVTFIPAESARLVRNTFRPGQRRGVPVMLPVSDDLADIEDMAKSELSTARCRSKLMAFVTHSAEELENVERKAFIEAVRGRMGDAGEDEAPEVIERQRYTALEDAVGGVVEYCEEGDKIDLPSIDRPNLDVATFFHFMGDGAGAALGLAQGYSRMAVSSSYTAHRGETCMTFRHILREQKKHEHDWLDWLAVKVIEFAIAAGKLPAGPDGWQDAVSWRMPTPDVIDPQKEAAADQQNMKNGKKNLLDIVGPDWQEKLDQTAEILEYARKKGIPLSMFETVAGAAAEVTNGNQEDEN
jgi:capsid protein